MATLDMSVRYFGNNVDDGRMPVRELAPALIALSESLQEIQRLENPGEAPLSLDIQATEKGSFVVDLILANGSDIFSKAIDLLNSEQSAAFVNLVTYVTTFYEVIQLTKASLGKKFKKQVDNDDGTVTLTFSDDTSLTISVKTLKAYRNVEVRRSIKEVVKPAANGGAAGVEFKSSKTETIRVTSSEAEQFEEPKVADTEFPPVISEVALQIISVGFDNVKWKFSDGANQFFASIEDEDFLNAVHQNKYQFGATDILRVRLRQTQTVTSKGLTSSYVVEKVLEHQKGARQIELDFE